MHLNLNLKDSVNRCFFDLEEHISVLCRCSWDRIPDGMFQRRDVEIIGRDDHRAALQHAHWTCLDSQVTQSVRVDVVE